MARFSTKVENEFIKPLIEIGVASQLGGAVVISIVTWLLWDFTTLEFFIQVIISTILLLCGAVVFIVWSAPGEVLTRLSSIARFFGKEVTRSEEQSKESRNVSYHERQTRIFRGLFGLALLDFILVTALDLQSGGIWRSPFTPMLPAIAAVGSILLLPKRQLSILYCFAIVLLFIGFANMPLHDKQRALGYFSAEPEFPSYGEIEEFIKESNTVNAEKQESYRQGLIAREYYEMARRRYEEQRSAWIWAITVVGSFAGLVSLASAYQAGTRLKYIFPREHKAKRTSTLPSGKELTLSKLVYDAEIEFNQIFMSFPFMAKYGPHLSNVHDLNVVRDQAGLLAIPALHWTRKNRMETEARDIALTTFAVHWIDDCFDSLLFMQDVTLWQAVFDLRPKKCEEIIKKLNEHLHETSPERCPLEEVFGVIRMCSKDPEFRTERAIKRIILGALIQRAPDPDFRNQLVRDLRKEVKKDLKDSKLLAAVESLSEGELWLTCKSVVELLHACEKRPPPLDVSEICNFFFAPLVGYSDKAEEIGNEEAGVVWHLVDGGATRDLGMLKSFNNLYSEILKDDLRKNLRLKQMVEVYDHYSQDGKLPHELGTVYEEIVKGLRNQKAYASVI